MTSPTQHPVPAWLGALSAQEQAVWDAFASGLLVDLRVGDARADAVSASDAWDAGRGVRAEVVKALLLGARPAEPGGVGAVRLRGAMILGDLDLADCEVRHALALSGCRIGALVADNASCRSIVLRGSRIASLSLADGRVDGVLDLRDCVFTDPTAAGHRVFLGGAEVLGSVLLGRAVVHGSVRCTTAVVRGTLRLNGTTIRNPGGPTLDARLLETGNQLLAERLHSVGTVDLSDARLGGRLVLDGATLENPGGDTLSCRQMSVAGEVSMRRGTVPFTSRGRIAMAGARIEGTLGLQESVLHGSDGALHARGITVGRSFRLTDADVDGTVLIAGAVIGEQLELSGSRLRSAEGYTLAGQGVRVAREARFERHTDSRGTLRPFRSEGTVHLDGASLGSNLRMHGAELVVPEGDVALNLSGAVITQGLRLKDGFTTSGEVRLVGARIQGHLNLSGMTSPDALLTLYGCSITEIYDEGTDPWPHRLQLDGLVYDNLAPYRPAAERLRLLRRQVGGYQPRPFEQLAAHYRRLGHDDEARAVLLARQRARRAARPWWRRAPGLLADLLTGHGYRPSRAAAWAAGLLAAGSVYFASHRPRAVHPEEHLVFNPFLYTADRLIPVVHFGPSDEWQSTGLSLAVASGLTVAGWALGIAIAAGASRALSRN
ncbi:hypothetical protein [Streptacidiphilus rugosus]|uniref:hypothetical protein n=1 Tax=Streptacidiphilus rugosus TaxID=405783 RepID=UPI00056C75D9|nr:hypothetical protein [Streptacidiphilus rugosus]